MVVWNWSVEGHLHTELQQRSSQQIKSQLDRVFQVCPEEGYVKDKSDISQKCVATGQKLYLSSEVSSKKMPTKYKALSR